MKLNLRQKERFYHQLGKLLRAGVAFPSALVTLSSETRGGLRRLIEHLRRATGRGESIGDAFASAQPAVSGLEAGIFLACERSGRLDEACRYLSEYFATLERARAAIVKKSAYPVFTLHFGVFVLALPSLFLGGTGAGYFKQTLSFLFAIYFVLGVVVFAVKGIVKLAESSAAVDRLLRLVPAVGKLRRSFTLSRFCATYEMQLQSGVNVIDGLLSAAHASRSALVTDAVERALPAIRSGAQVGPELSRSSAFTRDMMRAFRVGEDTGDLDEELKRLATEFHEEALSRIETVSEWLPRIVYVTIAVYLAFQIVATYQKVLGAYSKALDF
ncbi:MAG: type II secretion system F family protein [Verrucomicrobiota bacterium]|nr:type II secretion system F family protein [Verrucomicrobiota bacterium]